MVLKLYGFAQSTCMRTVGTTLHEKEIPFEFIPIDYSKGEHKSPEYLKKQPFGVVPYIDDDGFILYESRAICRYLEAKYPNQGTKLVPTGLKENVLFEQAASIEQNNFHPYASKAIAEVVFKPFRGQTPDMAVYNDMIKQLDAKLDAYNAILGQQKYLAGDDFSLADIFHLSYGALLGGKSDIMTQKPNVARWWNDITSRPSWQANKVKLTGQ